MKKERKSSTKQVITAEGSSIVETIDPVVDSPPPVPSTTTKDLGITVLETKKLSPLPIVKTEAGVTQLEIKPTQGQSKQMISSSITFATTGGSKAPQMIKLVPSNQFIQLKPSVSTASSVQPTRILALKSTPTTMLKQQQPTVMKTTTIAPGSKIYTLKSGPGGGNPQLVAIDKPQNFSPTKFTIMKQGSGGGGGPVASNASDSSSVTLSAESSPTTSDYSNILDMPVLFADSEGNIQQDEPPQHHQQVVTHSRPMQYFIQTKPSVTIAATSVNKEPTKYIQSGKCLSLSLSFVDRPSGVDYFPQAKILSSAT